MGPRPSIGGVVETVLYVADVEKAAEFYQRVLGLARLDGGESFVPLHAGGGSMLLLFRTGSAADGTTFEGGWIPPHGSHGTAHVALSIRSPDLDEWRAHLASQGVEIESEVQWTRGGTSLYLRDPDGHSVELVTPGIWPHY